MTKHGGSRPGSGRPKGSGFGRVVQESIHVYVRAEQKAKLQEYCEAAGVSISAAISSWIDSLPEKT